MKKKKQPEPLPIIQTEVEKLFQSFKHWDVQRVKTNKFRILKCEHIDGRVCFRFEYKTFWGWKTLTDNGLYHKSPIHLYAATKKEAAIFLQCHFGYGVVIVSEFTLV